MGIGLQGSGFAASLQGWRILGVSSFGGFGVDGVGVGAKGLGVGQFRLFARVSLVS